MKHVVSTCGVVHVDTHVALAEGHDTADLITTDLQPAQPLQTESV
jgi:hypothetical protein